MRYAERPRSIDAVHPPSPRQVDEGQGRIAAPSARPNCILSRATPPSVARRRSGFPARSTDPERPAVRGNPPRGKEAGVWSIRGDRAAGTGTVSPIAPGLTQGRNSSTRTSTITKFQATGQSAVSKPARPGRFRFGPRSENPPTVAKVTFFFIPSPVGLAKSATAARQARRAAPDARVRTWKPNRRAVRCRHAHYGKPFSRFPIAKSLAIDSERYVTGSGFEQATGKPGEAWAPPDPRRWTGMSPDGSVGQVSRVPTRKSVCLQLARCGSSCRDN